MNDNTIDSIEWHRDQLAKLLSGEDDFGKVESELDFILEKAKSTKKILVHRGGKTFYREQEVGRKEPEKKVGKTITTDSIKDIISDTGLGESQGSGDRGIQVYHDILRKVIDVKMNYGGHDEQNKAIRTENSNKIKTALDKAGVKYTTETDVIMPGQIYFTIPMN